MEISSFKELILIKENFVNLMRRQTNDWCLFLRTVTSYQVWKTSILTIFYLYYSNNFQQPLSQKIFMEEAFSDYQKNSTFSVKKLAWNINYIEEFLKKVLKILIKQQTLYFNVSCNFKKYIMIVFYLKWK